MFSSQRRPEWTRMVSSVLPGIGLQLRACLVAVYSCSTVSSQSNRSSSALLPGLHQPFSNHCDTQASHGLAYNSLSTLLYLLGKFISVFTVLKYCRSSAASQLFQYYLGSVCPFINLGKKKRKNRDYTEYWDALVKFVQHGDLWEGQREPCWWKHVVSLLSCCLGFFLHVPVLLKYSFFGPSWKVRRSTHSSSFTHSFTFLGAF